jgi:hypothetical protein
VRAPQFQAAIGALSALRSTSDYTHETVELNTDALIAQVAHSLLNHPSGPSPPTDGTQKAVSVIIPKLVLLSTPVEYKSRGSKSDCANIASGVNEQLGCLFRVRASADPTDPGFPALDKTLQAFIQSLMGGAASSDPTTSSKDASASQDKQGVQPDKAPAPADSSSKSSSSSVLGNIIQGRRLRSQLGSGTHILILEATTAGGSYKTLHNFWVELVYTTPAPSYNGGAVVTYMLINSSSSVVEASDVRRVMFRYGKFKKSEKVATADTPR